MKYYTETIPFILAEKLKEKGYWNPGCTFTSQYNNACYFKDGRFYNDGVVSDWDDLLPAPTYAEVFDWLMEKGKEIEIFYTPARGAYMYGIAPFPDYQIGGATWHDAANAAIEKALELIKK